MRVEDLIRPIRLTNMSYAELLARIRELREARVAYEPPQRKRRTARSKTTRVSRVDKLIEGMSEAERAEFVKMLEEKGDA